MSHDTNTLQSRIKALPLSTARLEVVSGFNQAAVPWIRTGIFSEMDMLFVQTDKLPSSAHSHIQFRTSSTL